MNKYFLKYFLFLILLLPANNIKSQTCGFGCLGLSGVFGGYTLQKYEADGLNQYLSHITNPYSSLANPDSDLNFSEGRGFKVGINVVRANYSDFFFTFKGYYQFLSEQHSEIINLGSLQNPNLILYDVKLEMNNWGIGLDLGVPLFGFIDWKIIEGELKFFSPKLTINLNENPIIEDDNTYTPDKVKMGYSIGTGIIFNIIKDYISLEVTGMHSYIEIDYLTGDEDGAKIPSDGNDANFISKGGYQASIQLNIGIPL